MAIDRIRGTASLGHAKITAEDTKRTILDWRLYLHYLAFLSASVAVSTVSLFAPTIVSGLGYENLAAQLFTVPPYAIAFAVQLTVAWLADRYQKQSLFALCTLTIAAVSFLAQGESLFQPLVTRGMLT